MQTAANETLRSHEGREEDQAPLEAAECLSNGFPTSAALALQQLMEDKMDQQAQTLSKQKR